MESLPRHVVLSIDVGSSSIRCTAYDITSAVAYDPLPVCAASSALRKVIQSGTGRILVYSDTNSEDRTLFDDIDQCVDEVVQQLNSCTDKVVAIGFSTLVMNLIGVDEHGIPIGNDTTMSYACQTPTVNQEVDRLKRMMSPEASQELYQHTGAPIHAAYALPQLSVWYQNSSKTNRVHRWQTIASVCIGRWTGQNDVPISYSETSWTGLLNFRTCQYEPSILKLLPPECLPALPHLADYTGESVTLDDDETAAPTCFRLTASLPSSQDGIDTKNPYWIRWTLLQNAQLFLGVGDGACANLGSSCDSHSHRIACTIGTSAASRFVVPCPIATDDRSMDSLMTMRLESGLFCYRIDRRRVLIGGALTDGGSALEWITNLLHVPMASEAFGASLMAATERLQECYRCQQELEPSSCSAHTTCAFPPLVLPFWSGERSTGYRTGATGAIFGLTLNTGVEDLILSTLEGVTLRLHAIIQLIRRVIGKSPAPLKILCSGKALERNALWRTMLADCTGLPVIMEEQTYEATSRGVAVLLLSVLTNEDEGSVAMRDHPASTIECSSQNTHLPNESARNYWDVRFQMQESILESMAPHFG